MKSKYYIFFLFFLCLFVYPQNQNNGRIVEDEKGNLIKNNSEIKVLENKSKVYQVEQYKNFLHKETVSSSSDICSIGGFEEYVNYSGIKYVKDFDFASIDNYPNSSQCVIPIDNCYYLCRKNEPVKNIERALFNYYHIPKYNYNVDLLSTTVPSNYVDPYLGNIKAIGQFALKLNRIGSGQDPFACIVNTVVTKTKNIIKFNYKVVMQTIMNDAHIDNQPFFKVRVLNLAGDVKSEWCIVADTENCIFKRKKENDTTYTLFTTDWKEGSLDLSSIPDNQQFIIQFVSARCGLTGHFSYAYIDNICL